MNEDKRYGFIRNTTPAQAYHDTTRLMNIAIAEGHNGGVKVWSNKQTAAIELLERSVGYIDYVEGFG